ncbi:MAG: PQQ-binding-like beta-propeller repeat protein, partial [Methanomassiliicoccales archaeon]|nr:PQQ-binding-like beta-propeller repeat protein [Methanomassiliicoccales archaeon]
MKNMANESRTGMKAAAVIIVIIIIIAAVAVGLLFLGQEGEQVTNPGTPPPEIVQYSSDWPLPNKDYNNTRATTDSTIRSTNVGTLGLAWSYLIQGVGAFGGAATTPLILGDTVYFQDLRNNVIALNFTTGAVKWNRFYNITDAVGPNGVAVGYGKVYAAKDLYNMTALDINTGADVWNARISNVSSTGIDIQPIVYDNLVYTSTVPGTGDIFYAPGGKGVLYALYQASGHVEWSFTTVDENLWGHPEVNSGG